MLVKVSGDSKVLSASNIQQALNQPENYIQQYSYQDQQVLNGDTLLMLQTQFEPKAINELISSAGQTLWGRNRPLLLIWLALEPEGQGLRLLGNDSQNQAHELLQQDANARGLPIVLPMLDLTDMQNLSAQQVMNGDTLAVQQASQRYNADATLTAQLQQLSDNSWQAHWQLLSDNQQIAGQTKGQTLDDVLFTMVNQVSDQLAANYSVNTTTTSSANIVLTVTDIKNLQDYAKVTRYLNNLTPVKSVEIAEVGSNTLTFNLMVVGGEASLIKALSLDHKLKPAPDADIKDEQQLHLTYQWML